MYLVRTVTYWYILGKTKIRKRKTLRFEQWISCIASCALFHYATSVHSMVIYMVNTWYIAPESYTRVARYLLAGVGRRARVQRLPPLLPWRHWSGHRLESPGCPFRLWNRASKLQCGDGPLPDWETGPCWREGRFHCTWHTQSVSVAESRPGLAPSLYRPAHWLDLPWLPQRQAKECRRTTSLHIVQPTWYTPVCTRCPCIKVVCTRTGLCHLGQARAGMYCHGYIL